MDVLSHPRESAKSTVAHVENTSDTDPAVLAQRWLTSLGDAVESKDVNLVTAHFLDDGYWRDLLALSFDNRTLHSIPKIEEFLLQGDRLRESGLRNFKLDGQPELTKANRDFTWIQCFFNFETNIARGRGFFRLMRDASDGAWKAKTLYTGAEEWKGYEEKRGPTRPSGVDHGENVERKSWKDTRDAKKELLDSEPEVVIIGAGQSGLALAACLGQTGVDALVVDKFERIGDNWRKRYNFLVLHDPVWSDHLPYISFPPHWPIFTPKDKLADWFEAYANTMDLNVWTSSTIREATYDDDSNRWTVTISRAGKAERILHPTFVVMATGHSGEPNIPTLDGIDKFKGHVCHSSQHTTGGDFRGKKAIVVGCCNSGHDIAQDFYEQGADVTIVQRSKTYVMSCDEGARILFRGLYEENGPPTSDADIMFNSRPYHMIQDLNRYVTEEIAEADKELLAGLTAAGFAIEWGPGKAGLMMLYLTRGGGYYIDVGASKLIIDGKIKLKQGQEIDHLTETSVVFADGTEIEADTVVLATGYKNMKTTAVKILGKEAERMGNVWGLDEEGEMNAIWSRNTGHPGLYVMGGNLMLVRFWSKRLALKIKAQVAGLAPIKAN
ncbi:putative flavin-containing monooxygenase YUCCA3 [Cylindrobasidium torrendii FP15055 ss-10]|uniref:Putative flavin-containing monooxygenase YUCCA3 n=1 Tax=Cylindrobasidium torrendii FP15055 ss-10 TaxID=1314674 RepID=A0A0D7B9Y8_9AGAR|nr:putative flavin-containing monooxygenase YUCCA3 [Cylindrobasidium torrendii FP15055 ss-10]